LKCAACTVPVMRTAAEQVSDLFLSLWWEQPNRFLICISLWWEQGCSLLIL
jgi:hypothetical protein